MQTVKPYLIYLDTDVTTYPNIQSRYDAWGGVWSIKICPAPSASRMESMMEMVREDYAPFDVTVTTNRTLYNSWPNYRVQVALVDTVSLGEGSSVGGNTGSCGVAFMPSYDERDNLVWVALCDATCAFSDGEVVNSISHEVGHTFGLKHDGRRVSGVFKEYLNGLPDPRPADWPISRVWNTIMGSGDTGITQWSRGEYTGSTLGRPPRTNTQDDLQMIGSVAGTRPGTYCNQVGTCLGTS
jgi:hypothetical protein